MPLYEIVLRYPDRDEVRITDHDPRVDGHVNVNGETWPLVAETRPSDASVARRYYVRVGPVHGEGSVMHDG